MNWEGICTLTALATDLQSVGLTHAQPVHGEYYIKKAYNNIDLWNQLHKNACPFILINTSMRLKEISRPIMELFNRPLKYTWTYNDNVTWVGLFHLDNLHTIKLTIHNSNNSNSWYASFSRINGSESSQSLTGDGNEFVIFSTIISMLKEFVVAVKPDELVFEAEKHNWMSPENSSRVKLYTTMCKQLASKFGYTYTVKDTARTKEYTLTRNRDE